MTSLRETLLGVWRPSRSRPTLDARPDYESDAVVEVETDVGKLLLHRNDRVMTPIILATKQWEPAETTFLRRNLGRDQTFVDCGANIGYFSLLGSSLVGSRGRVIAIEPEEQNLTLLRANLQHHGRTNVTVEPLAAYSHSGFVKFRFSEENRGDHQVEPASGGTLRVPCATLDELIDGDVDVVKIDTQGVDHEVIAGASKMIGRAGPITLLVEYWLDGMKERNVDPTSVLAHYRALGLDVALLGEDGQSRPASDDAIISACEAWDGHYVNLVLQGH